jgi:hypothetical protein
MSLSSFPSEAQQWTRSKLSRICQRTIHALHCICRCQDRGATSAGLATEGGASAAGDRIAAAAGNPLPAGSAVAKAARAVQNHTQQRQYCLGWPLVSGVAASYQQLIEKHAAAAILDLRILLMVTRTCNKSRHQLVDTAALGSPPPAAAVYSRLNRHWQQQSHTTSQNTQHGPPPDPCSRSTGL